MKKILILVITLMSNYLINAQAPNGFNYQAVVRNDTGEPITNTAVTVQFTILAGSSSGSTVYIESHSASTNPFGLINISVGSGTASLGSFSSIDWTSGSFFIKTEMDLGNGFLDFGTKQLLSVPFAMYGEDADADATNEIQSLTLNGSSLQISGGNSVDLGTLGVDTDDQTLSLLGTDLTISEGNTVDLSGLSGSSGTDDQKLTLDGNTLTLEDGGTVDLSGYLDNSDTKLTETEVDEFVANNGYLTSETDDQTLTLDGNTLTLENGGTVDLSSFLDNTDTQLTETEVDDFISNNGYLTTETDDQTLTLSGNSLALEDGGDVDLSGYLDNTDDQSLDLNVDNMLSIENANEVDLSPYLDNTDDQALTLNGTTLTLEDGGSVDLSPYAGQNTDSQALSISGNTLSLQNGGTVDLSAYLDNTDAQDLELNTNTLSLTNDATTVDLSGYLDNTDSQDLSDVLTQGADAGSNVITNLANPNDAQDAATKAYVDANNAFNNDGDFEVNTNPREMIDVDQTISNSSDVLLTQLAQSFVASSTGKLTEITFGVLIPGGGSPTINISIYNGEGVGGSNLATETFIVDSESPYKFSSDINVAATNSYTIFIEPTDPTKTMTVSLSTSNPYADGVFYRATSTVSLNSTSFPTWDAKFSTKILVPEQSAMFVGEEGVGIGTKTPQKSAALEISSTSGGILLPRMNTAQRDAISLPAPGLMVYNTEVNKFQGYIKSIGAPAIDATVTNNTGSNFSGSSSLGQSFIPSATGEITQIDVSRKQITSGSNAVLVLAIRDGDGYTGSIVFSETFGNISPATGILSFVFTDPFPVIGGNSYTFQVIGSPNYSAHVASDESTYTNGSGYSSSGVPLGKDVTFNMHLQLDNSSWVDLH